MVRVLDLVMLLLETELPLSRHRPLLIQYLGYLRGWNAFKSGILVVLEGGLSPRAARLGLVRAGMKDFLTHLSKLNLLERPKTGPA